MQFFVHIPKTAGTSFRLAAERKFSKKRVVYDYGPQSPVTSECALAYLYDPEKADKAQFFENCRKRDIRLIAGHKPASRFVHGVGVQNIITFVREPLERAFSGYLHLRRNGRFNGTFRQYFTDPMQTNTHARMLGRISHRALGFVGITEHYQASLRLINQHYGWRLRKKHVNRSRFYEPGLESVSQEDREAFQALNRADFMIYEDACWWFESRRELERQHAPFAHGQVDSAEDGAIRGWAWWAAGCEKPVEIEISINGEPVKTVAADKLQKRWANRGAPAAGHVGFVARVSKMAGNRIICRIKKTGQPLNQKPLSM